MCNKLLSFAGLVAFFLQLSNLQEVAVGALPHGGPQRFMQPRGFISRHIDGVKERVKRLHRLSHRLIDHTIGREVHREPSTALIEQLKVNHGLGFNVWVHCSFQQLLLFPDKGLQILLQLWEER